MIMLDTHVWVYLISEDQKQLSPKALRAIKHADSLLISAITSWEAALLIKKGRLQVTLEMERWINYGLKYPKLKVIDINPEILIKSVMLDGLHPDPANRIIVATSLLHNSPLITNDKRLLEWEGVETIW